MNRDDIIRMAEEAGLCRDDEVWYSRSDVDADVTTDDLERFAALVEKAAIGAPKPEPAPVAWMVYTLDGESVCVTDNPANFTSEHRALPLYATPPQSKPLTDEEICKCCQAMDAEPLAKGWPELIKFARAIERAHGIGDGR